MILMRPSFEIMAIMGVHKQPPGYETSPLTLIEQAGRTCYKSEDVIDPNSAKKFVANRLKDGHESVIEHSAITVKVVCDRGVTHEIVRHRLVAYSQESTRYCNYKGGVTFVIPPWVNVEIGEYKEVGLLTDMRNGCEWEISHCWFKAMARAEYSYLTLLNHGWSPQQARSVLPNSLKAEIVMTCNIREWRHILKLRTSEAAHPQMRETMIPILKEFQKRIPVLFDDIGNEGKEKRI